MTEKINIKQSVIAYVIDARLPLIRKISERFIILRRMMEIPAKEIFNPVEKNKLP